MAPAVTTQATASLLQARYGSRPGILVLPQGFDARRIPRPLVDVFETDRLELLYTGSFYSFRRPDALLAALAQVANVRLTIAAITVPEAVLKASREMPDRIRLLGFRPHDAILDLQRSTDVLVNIANDDMTQIPGKVNEYFGAGRPLLNLGPGSDPVSAEIDRLARGWNCRNEEVAIAAQLSALRIAKSERRLDSGLDLTPGRVEAFTWTSIAMRLDSAIRRDLSSG